MACNNFHQKMVLGVANSDARVFVNCIISTSLRFNKYDKILSSLPIKMCQSATDFALGSWKDLMSAFSWLAQMKWYGKRLSFQTEECVDADPWEATVHNLYLTAISGSVTVTCPGSPYSTTTTSSDGKPGEISHLFFNLILVTKFLCDKFHSNQNQILN